MANCELVRLLTIILLKMELECASNVILDFMRNLPEKFPAAHRPYVEQLGKEMHQRKELMVDFDALQASMDPGGLKADATEDEEKVNYELVLSNYFSTHGTLVNLSSFKLRGLQRSASDFPLAEGIRQLHSLTELDLAGNVLSNEMQESLQLWSITQLKTLKLGSTGLTKLPPSVGRLRKLETLSLNDNNLTALPVTLSFCQSITCLDLSKNKFNTIPGVVLQLKNLSDLRRLGNPLKQRWNGFGGFPHLVKLAIKPVKKTNPDSLQALCSKTVMTSHIDYWSENNFPPLQCKMLDSYASLYTYCENCHNAINTASNASAAESFSVVVMMQKFADLRDVPFTIHSCSACCDAVIQQITERQRQILKEMDEEYEKEMKQAMQSERMQDYKPPYIPPRTTHRRRRNNKKCTIM